VLRAGTAPLSQAVEDEKLPANPALRLGRYLRRGDEPKPVIQPLSRTEAAHLVTVARLHFPRWYPWVLLALRTGLRLGEQMALQWGDIEWHGQFIVVQRNVVRGVLTTPKSHQCRRVDMSPQLTMALKDWRRVQQARWLKKGQEMPASVFAARPGGVLQERNVRHVFARLLAKAALRHIRIHDLRHTFASRADEQPRGASLRAGDVSESLTSSVSGSSGSVRSVSLSWNGASDDLD
jgi:integrase